MSSVSDAIDDCIKQEVAPLLKSHGFTKAGRRWHKQVADSWQMVHVQASTGNVDSDGKFAVNLAVYQTEIESLCGNELNGGTPKESEGTVRTRLGVEDGNSDNWWSITPDSDLSGISNDVVEKLQAEGFVWLNEHLDIGAVSAHLMSQPSVQSFAAALLAGNSDEAVRRVQAAIEKRPRGETHFRECAKRLSLDI